MSRRRDSYFGGSTVIDPGWGEVTDDSVPTAQARATRQLIEEETRREQARPDIVRQLITLGNKRELAHEAMSGPGANLVDGITQLRILRAALVELQADAIEAGVSFHPHYGIGAELSQLDALIYEATDQLRGWTKSRSRLEAGFRARVRAVPLEITLTPAIGGNLERVLAGALRDGLFSDKNERGEDFGSIFALVAVVSLKRACLSGVLSCEARQLLDRCEQIATAKGQAPKRQQARENAMERLRSWYIEHCGWIGRGRPFSWLEV